MARTRREALLQLLCCARWSEAEAREVLAAAEKSGLALSAFAEEHGLGAERLYRWSRKLRVRPEAATFEEINVGGTTVDVEIELRSGRIVRVAAGIDPDALRRLLDAVEGDGVC